MEKIIDFMTNATILWVYLAAINVITFFLFLIDKVKAVKGKFRIRESTLLSLSFIGGALGGLLAMIICRHKIRKKAFTIGLPLMLGMHIIMIVFLIIIH